MQKRKCWPYVSALLGISISLLALGIPHAGAATIHGVTMPSDEPRIVAIGSPGEVVEKEVFQVQLDLSQASLSFTIFGYFTFIKGIDDNALFAESNPAKQNESTAFFTIFINAKILRTTKNGPFIVVDAATTAKAFFNSAPDGDFRNPDSFKEGIVIGAGEQTIQFIFDLTTGSGTGVVAGQQMFAPPFMLQGELIQFGEVRKITSLVQGRTMARHGSTRLFGAGSSVHAE